MRANVKGTITTFKNGLAVVDNTIVGLKKGMAVINGVWTKFWEAGGDIAYIADRCLLITEGDYYVEVYRGRIYPINDDNTLGENYIEFTLDNVIGKYLCQDCSAGAFMPDNTSYKNMADIYSGFIWLWNEDTKSYDTVQVSYNFKTDIATYTSALNIDSSPWIRSELSPNGDKLFLFVASTPSGTVQIDILVYDVGDDGLSYSHTLQKVIYYTNSFGSPNGNIIGITSVDISYDGSLMAISYTKYYDEDYLNIQKIIKLSGTSFSEIYSDIQNLSEARQCYEYLTPDGKYYITGNSASGSLSVYYINGTSLTKIGSVSPNIGDTAGFLLEYIYYYEEDGIVEIVYPYSTGKSTYFYTLVVTPTSVTALGYTNLSSCYTWRVGETGNHLVYGTTTYNEDTHCYGIISRDSTGKVTGFTKITDVNGYEDLYDDDYEVSYSFLGI